MSSVGISNLVPLFCSFSFPGVRVVEKLMMRRRRMLKKVSLVIGGKDDKRSAGSVHLHPGCPRKYIRQCSFQGWERWGARVAVKSWGPQTSSPLNYSVFNCACTDAKLAALVLNRDSSCQVMEVQYLGLVGVRKAPTCLFGVITAEVMRFFVSDKRFRELRSRCTPIWHRVDSTYLFMETLDANFCFFNRTLRDSRSYLCYFFRGHIYQINILKKKFFPHKFSQNLPPHTHTKCTLNAI